MAKRQTESQKMLKLLQHGLSKGGKKRRPWEGETEPPPSKGDIELALVKKPRRRGSNPKKIGGKIRARYGGWKTR
jgi:hypothetical protein